MISLNSSTNLEGISTASTLLLSELTDGGRIPFPIALSRLTLWESQLVQHVLGRTDIELAAEPSPTAVSISVRRSALAGVGFWGPDELSDDGGEQVGWLWVPPQVLDMVGEATRSAAAREAIESAEVDAVLREWETGGELDRRLVQLADWVERVETIYVFIDRDVFSKSDAGSNTLTRDGLLQKLRAVPTNEWRATDRLFVVLAHCLFVTGRSVRFEEFNGKQLTAGRAREFLVGRYADYCAALGRTALNPQGMPLFQLAEQVRDLMDEVDSSPMMRYRRINGLTFAKNEHLAEFPLPRDPETMPELVARYGSESLGLVPSGDVRADLRAMALAATALDDAAPDDGTDGAGTAGGAVGELLSAIVLSAIIETDSDYGMSSSVRDLGALRGAEPGGPDGVLELKKGDFFCCCLPHTKRMAATGEETAPILWRAAQRMMYNRWHFAPGEFDREVIPERRHYFFPPQIPDITEHSYRHHGGHVASRVNFTIRAPGAQVWHPPFTVFGHGYRGCYDIRLVRMDGPAYTTVELLEAVRHCSLVDELWRTLAEGVEDGSLPPRPVLGFDRAWYESRGWERLRPHLLAAEALTGAPLA